MDKDGASFFGNMASRTKFSTSYGLIVITPCGRVVLIQRKVPYCVQNFYMYLHRKHVPWRFDTLDPFAQVQTLFEAVWWPTLGDRDRQDYAAFLQKRGDAFEDAYDFPHGQTYRKQQSRFQCFLSAYREFREETGYRFSFRREDVARYPFLRLDFVGGDRHVYTQYYFVVRNVKNLKRFRYFDSMDATLADVQGWKDDRLVYRGKLMPLEQAYKVLKAQQAIKPDLKHWVCDRMLERDKRHAVGVVPKGVVPKGVVHKGVVQ